MAVFHSLGLHSPLLAPCSWSASLRSRRTVASTFSNHPRRPRTRYSAAASAAMDPKTDELRRKLMEFPYASPAQRNLMVDLIAMVDNRLGPQLLPCDLPPDVQYFENTSGTAHAALQIRSGDQSSPIDFMLESWIHSALPNGVSLSITSLSGYLTASSDSPNFLLELIQAGPSSLVLILDLPHRQDLVLNPDYLKSFYEDTNLDAHRQALESLPEAKPYVSPSLFVRCATSPTAVMFRVDAEAGRVEEIMGANVRPSARGVLGVWLEKCVGGARELGEAEREWIKERDRVFRRQTIEVDLGSSFPRMFGDEVAARVLSVMRRAYGV